MMVPREVHRVVLRGNSGHRSLKAPPISAYQGKSPCIWRYQAQQPEKARNTFLAGQKGLLINGSALKKETPCEKVSEVDLLIVCNPEPIERRKQPSQPLLVLRTDGRANAGFGTADLVTSALQQAARLRETGVSTLMGDTEQGAMQLGLAQCVAAAAGSTCLRLADLAANILALAISLSLCGWREGATP